MTKYKLIKEYPGSPAKGTVIELFEDSLDHTEAPSYPEFWKEFIEKEYEVLTLVSLTKQDPERMYCYLQEGDIYTYESTPTLGHPLQMTLQNDWAIYSVRRNSDGEIFTLGDNLITSFSDKNVRIPVLNIYLGNKTVLFSGNIEGKSFNNLPIKEAKKTKPLFTTEDGVDKHTGDSYYYVVKYNKDVIPNAWEVLKHVVDWESPIKPPLGAVQFDSKEAVKEWITMNKPCLSIKEIETSLGVLGARLRLLDKEVLIANLKIYVNDSK